MEAEFEDLKSAITEKTVLRSPNFELQFILQTDASARGVSAVLSQVFGGEGEKPVAFFQEVKWSIIEIEEECLAVILSIQHFAVDLISQKFILKIALQQLHTMANSKQQLMRWSLTFSCTSLMRSITLDTNTPMRTDFQGRNTGSLRLKKWRKCQGKHSRKPATLTELL